MVIHPLGVRAIPCSSNTPTDCKKLYFSHSMIETILKHLNLYLHKLRINYERARDNYETDFVVIFKSLGLFYMAGFEGKKNLHLKELWVIDKTPQNVRATMS